MGQNRLVPNCPLSEINYDIRSYSSNFERQSILSSLILKKRTHSSQNWIDNIRYPLDRHVKISLQKRLTNNFQIFRPFPVKSMKFKPAWSLKCGPRENHWQWPRNRLNIGSQKYHRILSSHSVFRTLYSTGKIMNSCESSFFSCWQSKINVAEKMTSFPRVSAW